MVNYWRVARTYWSIHLRTSMEYRVNFFVQAGFMMVNNALFLTAMYVLVGTLGTIQRYDFPVIATIFAVSALSYGIVNVFFGGIASLSEDIENGALDHHLGTPLPPLVSKGLSGMQEDAVGDIVFGIIVLLLFAPRPYLGIALSLVVSLLWCAVLILAQSLPFFLERSSRLTHNIKMVAVAFSSWPVNVYRPLVRTLLFVTLLAFLGAHPADVIHSFTWRGFGLLVGAVAIGAALSLVVFHRGLRRYESGNLVGMRG